MKTIRLNGLTIHLDQDHNKVVKNNDSAEMIYGKLLEGKAVEETVDEMLSMFDAPREVIMEDVLEVKNKMQETGII